MKKYFLYLVLFFLTMNISAQTVFIVNSLPSNTPEGSSLYLAGNMNAWNPGDENYKLKENSDGFPQISLNLNEGTVLQFKFTLGSWETVEKGENGEEISNREYFFSNHDTVYFSIKNWAGIENFVTEHTITENVEVLTDSFYIPQLDRYRRIWIYLPLDYAQSSSAYPVIYMHDGQNLFDAATSFSGEWNVDESLNQLFNLGHSAAIVVGIDNGGVERINELTPYANAQYGGGEGDLYLQFIVENLKPYIDEHYRTLKDREHTAIWGSSLGGLISLYGILKYENIFAKAGVFSPSLWFSDSIYTLASQVNKQYLSKIYFLAGGKEGNGTVPQECEQMITTLKQNSFENDELLLKTVDLGEHNEAFWRAEFSEAYLWLFEGINSVELNTEVSEFKIFPNPTIDSITIEHNKMGKFTIKVFNLEGMLIEQMQVQNSVKLDCTNWIKGMYILKIEYNGKTDVFKVNLVE